MSETVGAHIEVHITCGSADEAERIAELLVEDRLAACVHLVPIRSVYVWDGTTQRDEEVLVVAKTRSELFEPIAAAITAVHSYDLPAITALPLAGTAAYLAWVDAECGRPGTAQPSSL